MLHPIEILSIGPLWIIQSGSCIKQICSPLVHSSLLFHQSFLLRSNAFHGNAQQRLSEFQNSMSKKKKVEERKREWRLGGKWAPLLPLIVAMSFLWFSPNRAALLFFFSLSLFIKLTRFLSPVLSLFLSQDHSFFPLVFTGCRLAGL